MPAAPALTPAELAARRTARIMRRRYQEGEPIGNGPSSGWKWFAGFLGLPVKMGAMETASPPWANWGLCAAVFLAGLLTMSGDLRATVNGWGFLPADPMRHGGLTWIAPFFIHAGLFHLLGNLWFLWMTGDNVADGLGPRRYFGLLLVATVAGNLAHLLGDPRSDMPCVGASGGIAGVMAAFAVLYPRAQIGQAWFFGRVWLRLPAWGWLGVWILMQLWLARQQIGGFSNVSALAHLGGAAAGGVLGWRWRPPPESDDDLLAATPPPTRP